MARPAGCLGRLLGAANSSSNSRSSGRDSRAVPGTRGRQRAPVAHRRRGDERAQRVAHGLLDHALHADAIAETHLELGGVDVHVHVLRRDLEPEVAATGRSPGWIAER